MAAREGRAFENEFRFDEAGLGGEIGGKRRDGEEGEEKVFHFVRGLRR